MSLKTLGLAAIMALAAMAFVGVGSASAVEQKTVLCEEEPNMEGVCEGGIYSGGLTATGGATELTVEILGVEVAITCASSVEGETTAEKGQPQLPGIFTKFNLTNCVDSLERPCTVGEGLQLPWNWLLSQDKITPGNGHLTVWEANQGGQPGFVAVCQDSNPFTPDTNCAWKSDESNAQAPGKDVFNLTFKGGAQPRIEADGVELKEVGSKCTGTGVLWFGSYDVSPKNLWAAHVIQ